MCLLGCYNPMIKTRIMIIIILKGYINVLDNINLILIIQISLEKYVSLIYNTNYNLYITYILYI